MIIDIEALVFALSVGQRSAICNMDENPCILGCSEPVAIRLSRPVGKRPALVERTPSKPYHLFSLNVLGLQVKDYIVKLRLAA